MTTLDEATVQRDVAKAVKAALIPPFTTKNFTFAIVPSAEPMDGIGADAEAWARDLQRIVAALHAMPGRPEYGRLVLENTDARDTVNEPLSVTVTLLAKRIVAAAAAAAVSPVGRGQ